MLDSLRDSKTSVFIQVIIAVIVLSFIFFVGMGGTGQQIQVVATVNGERITDSAYVQAYRSQYERYRQFSGQAPTEDMDAMIRQQVLDQLITEKLILQQAEKMGLAVSDYELARAIADISWLKDENGKFDKERYAKFIERQPGFEQSLSEDLLSTKVRRLVSDSVQVSDLELKGYFLSQSEQVNLEFVRISEFSVQGEIQISDADLQDAVAKRSAEIQSQYDKDFERKYNLPRRVKARHILLKADQSTPPELDATLKTKMEEILAQARATPTAAAFGELAMRWSEDPSNAGKGGDLGLFDEKRMDPAFSAAAFALQPGGISEVVKSAFGYHIIFAEEFQDARVIPKEEVQNDIARELLQKEKAKARTAELAEQIRQAWARGEDITPLLTASSLSVQETGLFERSSGRIPRVGAGGDALDLAFSLTDEKAIPDKAVEVPGGQAVFKLKERKGADMEAFEREKEALRDRLLREKQAAVLEGWITGLKASAKIEAFGYQPPAT